MVVVVAMASRFERELDLGMRAGGVPVKVLQVPGHCEDQVAFLLPDRGALFSGDAFLYEQPRVFRADEDFHASVESLEALLQEDFEHLCCAHRPRLHVGKHALQQKLEVRRGAAYQLQLACAVAA